MFSRNKKNKNRKSGLFGRKSSSKTPQKTSNFSKNGDSDYDDSQTAQDEVYVAPAPVQQPQQRQVRVLTPGPSTPEVRTPVVPSEPPQEPTPELTDEERKARARKAVEERKKKSRAQIAARRAKAAGKEVPVAVTPEKEEVASPPPPPPTPKSEERNRILEEERKRQQEEREMLEKEEAEMRELEEALKKEEEEAKQLAEQYSKVVVETVDSEEIKEEVAESKEVAVETVETEVIKEEEAESDEKAAEAAAEAEKAAVEAEFEALAKQEAEEARAADLARLEAELTGATATNESAEDLLNQFVDINDDKVDFVGDVKEQEIAAAPDLDKDLDDLLGSSSILDEALDGPIKYTEPTPTVLEKKKVETKPETTSKRDTSSKSTSSKSTSKPKRKSATSIFRRPEKKTENKKEKKSAKIEKKPSFSRSFRPKPKTKTTTTTAAKKTVKAPPKPVTKPKKLKPKPPPVKTAPPKPPPVKTAPPKPKPKKVQVSNVPAVIRPKTKPRPAAPAATPMSAAVSIDSFGSQCTFNSLPINPYTRYATNTPTCNHKYVPTLHKKLLGCQVCVFKLSDREKDQFENNGRHIRVAMTAGGCIDCQIFPPGEEEDPVRICRKCFFDTHLPRIRRREPFSGTGDLAGVQKDQLTYDPTTHRYKGPRSGASVS